MSKKLKKYYFFIFFDFDFNILTALKDWVGHAPQGRGALQRKIPNYLGTTTFVCSTLPLLCNPIR